MVCKKTKLFIPRSSGLGWTLNPNHPIAWIVLIGCFALAIYYFIK